MFSNFSIVFGLHLSLPRELKFSGDSAICSTPQVKAAFVMTP
jgi:hypothetical protein